MIQSDSINKFIRPKPKKTTQQKKHGRYILHDIWLHVHLRRLRNDRGTWSWGTARKERGARSREVAAKRGRRQIIERETEWASKDEQHKPWFLKGLFLFHKDPPMLVGMSIANSRMEMATSLLFLPIFPFFSVSCSRFLAIEICTKLRRVSFFLLHR